MRLALVVGYRVFCCDNMAFHGDFTPVLAKHSKNFSLVDSIALGVERMQRNFEPMVKQVESWRAEQITDDLAKLTIYRASPFCAPGKRHCEPEDSILTPGIGYCITPFPSFLGRPRTENRVHFSYVSIVHPWDGTETPRMSS